MTREQAFNEFVTGTHAQIVRFGLKAFKEYGRGVVTTTVPQIGRVPGTTVLSTGELNYSTLEDFKQMLMTIRENADAMHDGNVTLRMIETYDPATQVVVMVDLEEFGPMSGKVRVNPATVLPDDGQVH